MASSLRSKLVDLASAFTASVLELVRAAPLEELASGDTAPAPPAKKRAGARAKASKRGGAAARPRAAAKRSRPAGSAKRIKTRAPKERKDAADEREREREAGAPAPGDEPSPPPPSELEAPEANGDVSEP